MRGLGEDVTRERERERERDPHLLDVTAPCGGSEKTSPERERERERDATQACILAHGRVFRAGHPSANSGGAAKGITLVRNRNTIRGTTLVRNRRIAKGRKGLQNDSKMSPKFGSKRNWRGVSDRGRKWRTLFCVNWLLA